MAVNQNRNVIFIDAPTAGVSVLGTGVQGRLGAIQVIHGATAVAELILYGAQSVSAVDTLFHFRGQHQLRQAWTSSRSSLTQGKVSCSLTTGYSLS